MTQPHRLSFAAVAAVVVAATAAVTPMQAASAGPDLGPIPVAPDTGYGPTLSRAPYLTDLTQTSVAINWATTTPLAGTLRWGPVGGSCRVNRIGAPPTLPLLSSGGSTPSSATTRAFTVGPVREYQSTVELTGLQPSTTYCYRVRAATAPLNLLGTNPSPTFTTLDPVGAALAGPLTFDVVGDLGQTQQWPGVEFPNHLNPDQAAIDTLIGSSRARFVIAAGDIAYIGGTESNYGDLHQVGPQVSDIFGPSYWPKTGGLPTFATEGNHGQNITTLRVWPEARTVAASGGTYAYDAYPAGTDGTKAATYPDSWYAVSTGNVRIYVLDASWSEGRTGNLGSATGAACGPVDTRYSLGCKGYQVDRDEHWETTSPEYRWLAADLARHPGGIKLAVWHYPLRSAAGPQPSDAYLQNSAANPFRATSLERLLYDNGVRLVFNAHAHTYQRIVPKGADQVTNYVTGGGGAVLSPVLGGHSCAALETTATVYALGFDERSGRGSSCGTAPPQSAAQVFNFLRVTVYGNQVTVTPVNAEGQTFDVHTYTF